MLQELTKKLIAGGDLSEDEAAASLEAIFSDGVPDATIASFLTALSIKGESPAEIAGFARAMRRHSIKITSDHEKLVDTAGTGGGAETFNISTTAAFVIAGAGLPVAKHGNRAVTSRCGSADLLAELGVRINAGVEVMERCLDEIGIAFMFAPLYHPAMKRVAVIRRQLGHRTIFNMLGPLTNPASAPFQIIGVYSPELTDKLAQALSLLGCRRAWVVHSEDGLDELSTTSPTFVAEVNGTGVKKITVSPQTLGFETCTIDEFAGSTPEDNAAIAREILTGKAAGPCRDVVVLNAAAALHIAGEGSLETTIRMAEESIDSGAASDKLHHFVELTNA